MIEKHVEVTHSPQGEEILKSWDKALAHFTKIIPTDYRRMLENIDKASALGYQGDEAMMVAFKESFNEPSLGLQPLESEASAQN
jgi:glutamate synthase (ferredoxin)